MEDFSLQGKVYLAERMANGKAGAMHWVNDAGLLNIAGTQSEETRKESYSGLRQTSATLSTGVEVTFNLTLRHGSAKNLALGLYGTVREVIAAAATGEVFPDGLVAGNIVALDRGNISNLIVNDSADPAVPLVLDTNYVIDSAAGGTIEIVDPALLTQPFTADYDYGGSTDVTMFTKAPPVRYLVMDGVNTVDGSGNRVRIQLYKLKFNPVGQLDLINDTFAEMSLSGTAMLDTTAAEDEALGGYGRIELLLEAAE